VPLAIVSVAVALRFWRLGDAALIGDESYYWLWSEHLAPSYYDNPAGVAVIVRLSTLIAGQSEVGIRWLNATLGVGAVLLIYLIGMRLFSWPASAIAAASLAIGAPYLVTSRFVYTDALHLFTVLLSLYLTIPFLVQGRTDLGALRKNLKGLPGPRTRRASGACPERGQWDPGRGGSGRPSGASIPMWRFWAAGLAMAAVLNTKYSAYLYALSLAALLGWTQRGLLRDRRTWWAVGVALCGLLPTVLWNALHQWASFRWQVQHFVVGALYSSTPWGNLRHAVNYLTPPLALLAALGATRARGVRQRTLLIPAIVLIVPVILSPANSPRNLTTGVALLLPLAGYAIGCWLERAHRVTACLLLGVLAVWTCTFGIGTIIETRQPTLLPHTALATAIREDGLGWRSAGDLDLDPEVIMFALDYSIAAQLRYYTGIPAYTSWEQYRLWGIPEICGSGGDEVRDVQIVALSHVDPSVISERLLRAFNEAHGPKERMLREAEETKVLRTWTARDCRVDLATLVELLDFIDLMRASADRQGSGDEGGSTSEATRFPQGQDSCLLQITIWAPHPSPLEKVWT
jgi:4-amino-4-deoxy-L-arabinose transferase-like glycosyltransferase